MNREGKNGRSEKSPPWIIIALIVLAISGTIAATVILSQGGPEASTNVQLVLTFLSPIIVGLLIALQGQKTHNLVNSTALELREVKTELARAEGVIIGVAQEAAMPPREKEVDIK